MISNNVVIFHDNNDEDIRLGLSFIWEIYKTNGCRNWFNGNDILNNGFIGIDPCDVIFINCTLPTDVLSVLNHNGFRLIFIGNKFSPVVTYANSLSYEICMIDSGSPISAIMYGYYVYLHHYRMGNRLDYLPSKFVSDDLNFIYNNKLTELTTISLTSGVYIAGINGLHLKQNIGSAVLLNDSVRPRLYDLEKDKGILYV